MLLGHNRRDMYSDYTGGHYITVEVNYTEALQDNCWNVMVADSLGVGHSRVQMNNENLEKNWSYKISQIVKFIK